MEAIPLPKREPSVSVVSSPDNASSSAALAATLQVTAQLSQGAYIQGWLMTLAYLPFGLILAIWAAYPAATGTGLPIFDTIVGLLITATGMVGSLGMGSMTLRLAQQSRYWRNGALEIEEQLGGRSELFKREASLMNGEAVHVGGERMRLSSLERPGRITAFHIFYGMFTLVFSFLLMANFLRFGRVI